jgi:uncharacterized membrane protein
LSKTAPNKTRLFQPQIALRVLLCVLVLGVYPALSHYAVTHERYDLAVGALLTLLICIGACLPGRARWLLAVPVPLLAILYFVEPRQLLFVPPVLINLLGGALFAASLRRGREPVISRIARLDRGELSNELAVYTRRLTWIWTFFFAFMVLLCVLLALSAPLPVWSLFANIINYLLVGLLFFGEFVYRRLRYSHYVHASPLRVILRIWDEAAARRQR